jgi:hypothetical protein
MNSYLPRIQMIVWPAGPGITVTGKLDNGIQGRSIRVELASDCASARRRRATDRDRAAAQAGPTSVPRHGLSRRVAAAGALALAS